MGSHDLNHFLGCFFLTVIIHRIGMPVIPAAVLAFVLGFVWEILDHLNKEYCWDWKILDPRGFSWKDVIIDFIGSGLAVPVLNGICK